MKDTILEEAKQAKTFGFGLKPDIEIEYALWQATCCVGLARRLLACGVSDLFAESAARGLTGQAISALGRAEAAIGEAETALAQVPR